MKKAQLSFLIILSILTSIIQATENFTQQWQHMQIIYKDLNNICNSEQYKIFQSQYCHHIWKKNQKQLKQLILGKPNQKFLNHSKIRGTMVRSGMTDGQQYELYFLTKCISLQTYEYIKSYHDSSFGGTTPICKEFNCSVNTLGHLFYTAKIFEQADINNIQTIVEFGSGYGNLARILKTMIPSSTIILIDVPELLALQYLFLKRTLTDISIIVHTKPTTTFEEGAIHLLPVFMLNDFDIYTDLFVSNFALSETTQSMQKFVVKKKFFDARFCYITGQIDGWQNYFVSHETILDGVRSCYPTVSCQPFHLFTQNKYSYEIMGHY